MIEICSCKRETDAIGRTGESRSDAVCRQSESGNRPHVAGQKISYVATDIRQAFAYIPVPIRVEAQNRHQAGELICINGCRRKRIQSPVCSCSRSRRKPMIAAGTYPDELEIIPEYGARIKYL